MKESFPNLVKEIDMQSRKSRVQIMMDVKRPTSRYFLIKRPKVKDKERLLKAGKKKISYRKFARWEGEGGEWVKR